MKLAAELSPLQRVKSKVTKSALQRLPSNLVVVRGVTDTAVPTVALTFDDGPDEMSGAYLDLLDELEICVTFFVIGENVVKRPDRVLEMVRRGHEVVGHGYTHTPFPTLHGIALSRELRETADLLPASRAPRPLVRPPRGAISLPSLAEVFAFGFTSVLWSMDSDDCRTDDPEVVAAKVSPENVTPGEIVLMHEGQEWTLKSLPKIVRRLREAGYRFVTTSECLGY